MPHRFTLGPPGISSGRRNTARLSVVPAGAGGSRLCPSEQRLRAGEVPITNWNVTPEVHPQPPGPKPPDGPDHVLRRCERIERPRTLQEIWEIACVPCRHPRRGQREAPLAQQENVNTVDSFDGGDPPGDETARLRPLQGSDHNLKREP